MPLEAQHVRRFLHGSDALSALLTELQRREALLQRVRALMPVSVARHCTGATLEDGRLTLCCASPAWVDRLRFLSPQLVAALVQAGEPVDACRVHARPSAVSRPVQSGKAAADRPGPDSVAAVEQAAQVHGNSPLGDSLQRLARTLRGASGMG
jgi:hypothetical protein